MPPAFPAVSAYAGLRGALTQVACGSFPNPGTRAATTGVTYHIMVSSQIGTPGPTILNIRVVVPPTPAPNDDFDHATAVAALPFTDVVDVPGATAAADDPTACGGAASSVWYRLTPSISETFTISTAGSTYQNSVSVYIGSRGALTQIACQDLFSTPGPAKWAGTAGVTYFILASAQFGANTGDHLTLNVTGSLPPANDDFNNANVVPALPLTDTLNASGATAAADDPTGCCGSRIARSGTASPRPSPRRS